jgi:hypothetical protein
MVMIFGSAIAFLADTSVVAQTATSGRLGSSTELRDVCPDGWSRYRCSSDRVEEEGGIRLCVSPGVQIGPEAQGVCRKDPLIVPEAWSHASPDEVGWEEANCGSNCTILVTNVVRLDSDTFDRYRKEVLARNHLSLKGYYQEHPDMLAATVVVDLLSDSARGGEWSAIQNYKRLDYLTSEERTLVQKWLPPPKPKSTAIEVCPSGWQRYSCKFSRLCVSPEVAAKYDLNNARAFSCHDCKLDENIVSEPDTHASAREVGFIAGGMIQVPKYTSVVNLNLPDIGDGNLDEAMERLLMIPPGIKANRDYYEGFGMGLANLKALIPQIIQAAASQGTKKKP